MRIFKAIIFAAAILFIEALFIIQIYYSYSGWSQTKRLFSVTQIYTLPYDGVMSFHLPGQKKELIIAKRPESTDTPRNFRLNIVFPFTKTLSQISYIKDMLIPRYWSYFKPFDSDNDGDIEIPIFGIENRKVVLELRDLNGKILEKTILESPAIPIHTDNLSVGIIEIADIDLDGKKEILWRMEAGWDGLPRGLAVHDLVSGKKKWELLYGAIPFQTTVKDINGDGKMEIIFTAWASHGGFTYNDMNDDTSYVGVLDSNGKLLWIKESGYFFTQLFMAVEDLEHDGKFEVITARSCHRENDPDPGQIQVYDAISGNILHSFLEQGVSFINLYVVDINNDTNLEIISSDTGGRLRIWDHNLKTLYEYNNNANIKVVGVEKVPGHSFPFIFTWCSLKDLRVLDHRLRPIFNFQITNEVLNPRPIVPVSDGEKISFILSAGHTYLITPKSSITLKDYLILFWSPFSWYLLGLIIFNGLIYFEFKKRKKLKSYYLELIKKGIKTDLTTAQEALHKMKSPLTAILWETEKIDQLLEKKRQPKTLPSRLKQISQSIMADLNELKIMNRFLMKFLQVQAMQLQEIHIKEVLTELLDKYRANLSDKFSFVINLPTFLPSLLADEEQLKEVFYIVIDNAIDAMPGGGTINITATFHKILLKENRKNIICVEVVDTGCGIPDDKLARIFEPYYTTKKEGTGIGLSIARRIIESHDGWIEVESKEKIGTKFALYFPVKNL